MGLYFCKWNDRVSVLVNADDEKDARKCATELAEGDAPTKVFDMPPRTFVAEVEEINENDAGEMMAVDVMPHSLEVLHAFEVDEDEDVRSEIDLIVNARTCPSTAVDSDDAEVTCRLPAGHDGQHESGGLVWDD